MSLKGVNGSALAITTAGGLFLWSGLKGRSITSVLRELVGGKQPGTTPDYPVAGQASALTPAPAAGSGVGPAAGGIAGAAASVAQNQATAKLLAAPYGWSSGPEWDALVALWQQESSWSNTATGPLAQGSHAYGIPQALPPSKLPKAGQPPSMGGTSDPQAQIKWGLSYIKSRYGRPSVAWGGYAARGGWY